MRTCLRDALDLRKGCGRAGHGPGHGRQDVEMEVATLCYEIRDRSWVGSLDDVAGNRLQQIHGVVAGHTVVRKAMSIGLRPDLLAERRRVRGEDIGSE
jgi:hypothetical protein